MNVAGDSPEHQNCVVAAIDSPMNQSNCVLVPVAGSPSDSEVENIICLSISSHNSNAIEQWRLASAIDSPVAPVGRQRRSLPCRASDDSSSVGGMSSSGRRACDDPC